MKPFFKLFVFLVIFCTCKTYEAATATTKSTTPISTKLHDSLLVPTDKWKERDCECGVPRPDMGYRKINNLTVKRGELPWIVSITVVKNNQSYKDRVHLCSGSLINFRHVLTSAGCVKGFTKNNLRTELIGYHVNSSRLHRIQSVKFHPLYRNGHDHGIALLKLDYYIKPSTMATPVCLPSVLKRYNDQNSTMVGDKFLQYKDVLIKRWLHRKSQEYPSTPIYAQLNVKFVDGENCSKLYPYMLKSKTFCITAQDPDSALSKYREDFFCFVRIESGVPSMAVVLIQRQISEDKQRFFQKHFITGLSSIDSGCSTNGDSKLHTNSLYKIEEYESWIRDNSLDGYYCKN